MYRHYRSSHRRCSIKKDILKNFAKFIGKYLCQSLFFNNVVFIIHPDFLEIRINQLHKQHLETIENQLILRVAGLFLNFPSFFQEILLLCNLILQSKWIKLCQNASKCQNFTKGSILMTCYPILVIC